MLAVERYEKIVGVVNERGAIRVTELSEIFQVTEETIRRDLDRLEQAGRLRRSHGGAVSLKELNEEKPFFVREIEGVEEKARIAKAAISLIEPNDRILLDASTTAWYMASELPDAALTVLTNSIKVTTELSSKEKIEVIATGGSLAHRSMSFVGPLTERSLEAYHVRKLFLSCKGIHFERGVSESNEMQARIKQKMLSIADQVILLADYSKFGVQAFTHVVDLSEVDVIVTDNRMQQEEQERLRDMGITVITA